MTNKDLEGKRVMVYFMTFTSEQPIIQLRFELGIPQIPDLQ
jgi:hypothetical protein